MKQEHNNQTLEALKAELEKKEAEQKGLTSHKRALKRKIAELEAAKAVAEAETKVEEAEVTPAVVETDADAEETIVGAVVFEFDDEEEVAPVAVETESEEEEVEAAPVAVEAESEEEEAEAAPVAVETESEEEEVEAAPVAVEAEPEEEEVEAAPAVVESEANAEDANASPAPAKDHKSAMTILGTGLILSLVLAFILACALISNRGKEPTSDGMPGTTGGVINTIEQPSDTQEPGTSEQPGTTEEPGTSEQPTIPDDPEFEISKFKTSVVAIASQYAADEDIAANADIFVENIGEDKLVELIEKYGELQVKKSIAEMLVFVPEIKMMQYVANNNLNYNPNASEDYNAKLLAADQAYKDATGLNPDGVLMSKEWYETLKSSQTAVKAKLVEEGETALLEWYTVKTSENAVKWQQINDTKVAEEYKQKVKLELVNSDGAIDLLQLQLEKETSGELVAMDNVSMQYTEAYNSFILNNYIYVIAN